MVDKVNCYTVDHTDVEEGIALSQDRAGRHAVAVGPEHNRAFIRIGDIAGNRKPHIRDRRVTYAHVTELRRHFHLLSGGTWGGILLYIAVKNLDFRIDPLAAKLSVNPGGEGVRPVMQRGEHRDRFNKCQLFRVESGETLLVIDQKAAILSITCRGGLPIVRPATREEVISHVFQYGLSARGHSEITWAVHTIRALGGGTSEQLRARLRHAS